MIERYTNLRLTGNDLKKLEMKDIHDILKEEHLVLSGETCLENIKSLTQQIKRIQKAVKEKMRIQKPFDLLMTIPGIGEILALTIMLEVGDIGRFPSVGDFASYCRCVPSDRRSAGKSKGKGNTKNGNR
jgi:transposase